MLRHCAISRPRKSSTHSVRATSTTEDHPKRRIPKVSDDAFEPANAADAFFWPNRSFVRYFANKRTQTKWITLIWIKYSSKIVLFISFVLPNRLILANFTSLHQWTALGFVLLAVVSFATNNIFQPIECTPGTLFNFSEREIRNR